MDGIFKRLTRLARAELNDLSDRLARADARRRGQDPGQGHEAPPEGGHEAREPARARPRATSERWPREIRAAYAALELPLGADRAEARAAYRKLLSRYHPDRHQAHPDKLATANELTRRLREQYELLDAWLAERAGG